MGIGKFRTEESKMSISFGRAVRSNVNLLIGVAGASGSGKTFSALRMASGICEGEPFAVIDTERGRSKHYADQFKFDVAELEQPFSPARYLEAIEAADKAGYGCIVVDSMSHSWAGEGGCMDMQEAELDRMAGKDLEKRERVKLLSWAKPKLEHKRMGYRRQGEASRTEASRERQGHRRRLGAGSAGSA